MRFMLRAIVFVLVVAGLSLAVAQFPSAEEPRPVAKTTAPQKTSTPEQTRIFEVRYRPTAEESCTVRHAYEGNTPHGEWIWKDATGKVLQTARFERGEVVDWNGQAVERELEEWFNRNHIPERCRTGLRARVGNVKWWYEDSILQFGVEEVPFHDSSQMFEMFLGGYHDWDRVREMGGARQATVRRQRGNIFSARSLAEKPHFGCALQHSTADPHLHDGNELA